MQKAGGTAESFQMMHGSIKTETGSVLPVYFYSADVLLGLTFSDPVHGLIEKYPYHQGPLNSAFSAYRFFAKPQAFYIYTKKLFLLFHVAVKRADSIKY